MLLRPGDTVAVEDPVYTGLKNLLAGMGARLVGIPVAADGLDLAQLARALEHERPRFLVVTSNFQNPTGADAAAATRGTGCWRRPARRASRWWRTTLTASCGTGANRCRPSSNWTAAAARCCCAASRRSVFRGCGWAGRLDRRPLIDRLRQAKEASDLHTDQLSQAVLLEFAESGRLEAHRARVLKAGAERLAATLEACRGVCPPERAGRAPRAA